MVAMTLEIRPAPPQTVAHLRHLEGLPRPGAANPGVEEHLHLVAQEARRLARRLPHSVLAEDLVGAGCMGLMHAVRSYDAARGTEFAAYARFRIRGAMLDELRELDVLPRRARAAMNRLERARHTFVAAHQREPTKQELAHAARITDGAVDQLLLMGERARSAQTADSMDIPVSESETTQDHAEQLETRRHLANAMARLSTRHQQVLAAYYQRELTFREIGASLGVTESRVCQIHAEAVNTLRQFM